MEDNCHSNISVYFVFWNLWLPNISKNEKAVAQQMRQTHTAGFTVKEAVRNNQSLLLSSDSQSFVFSFMKTDISEAQHS